MGTQLVEQLEELPVDERDSMRILRIGLALSPALKEELGRFLKENLDLFAWPHDDMDGIDPEVMCYCLNVDPSYPSKRQKHQLMNPDRYEALK